MENAKHAFLKIIRNSQKHVLGVTDKLRYQIDNLEARIACSIIEGKNAIKTGRTDLYHAKRMIIS